MHHHSSHLHHHIFLSWLVSNFSCFIFVVELPCWWSTLFKTKKKMLTKVTLKEFMRILPQLEFAIKRLVNLKNHYYSSMLFGTWKKNVFKSAWCSRLLHNRCNLMAPIKKFFQLRIFSVTIFLCTDSFSHHIFKAYFHCVLLILWCGDFPLLSPPLLLIHFWPLKCCGLVIFHGRSLYEFWSVKISVMKRARKRRQKKDFL